MTLPDSDPEILRRMHWRSTRVVGMNLLTEQDAAEVAQAIRDEERARCLEIVADVSDEALGTTTGAQTVLAIVNERIKDGAA